MNNHLADRWSFYSKKISFPYHRQVGVNGEFVRFESGEEEQFCQFLRTPEAAYLWSDSEDLQLMANLYQMTIKIITIKDDGIEIPVVNFVGPDIDLRAFRMLPDGKVPEMVLLHYDEQHYNLVISKNCDLAKHGILSDIVKEKEENEFVVEDLEEGTKGEKTIEEQLEVLIK